MASDFEKTLEAKSDQINAADLVGREMMVTISGVKVNTRDDQPVSFSLDGEQRAYRPCKAMRRLIAAVWGADPQVYVGRTLSLFRDPDVTWGADVVGGIRINAASHIDTEKKVTVPIKRGKVKTYVVRPLQTKQEPKEPDNALELCEAAARQGEAHFRAWWGTDEGKSVRVTANRNMDRLKELIAETQKPQDDEAPI